MNPNLKMLLLVLFVGVFLCGCAAIKKANSELVPSDVAAQSAQIQAAVTPYAPAPVQPFIPLISGALGYVVCLVRQMYKDHQSELAALKAKNAAPTTDG